MKLKRDRRGMRFNPIKRDTPIANADDSKEIVEISTFAMDTVFDGDTLGDLVEKISGIDTTIKLNSLQFLSELLSNGIEGNQFKIMLKKNITRRLLNNLSDEDKNVQYQSIEILSQLSILAAPDTKTELVNIGVVASVCAILNDFHPSAVEIFQSAQPTDASFQASTKVLNSTFVLLSELCEASNKSIDQVMSTFDRETWKFLLDLVTVSDLEISERVVLSWRLVTSVLELMCICSDYNPKRCHKLFGSKSVFLTLMETTEKHWIKLEESQTQEIEPRWLQILAALVLYNLSRAQKVVGTHVLKTIYTTFSSALDLTLTENALKMTNTEDGSSLFITAKNRLVTVQLSLEGLSNMHADEDGELQDDESNKEFFGVYENETDTLMKDSEENGEDMEQEGRSEEACNDDKDTRMNGVVEIADDMHEFEDEVIMTRRSLIATLFVEEKIFEKIWTHIQAFASVSSDFMLQSLVRETYSRALTCLVNFYFSLESAELELCEEKAHGFSEHLKSTLLTETYKNVVEYCSQKDMSDVAVQWCMLMMALTRCLSELLPTSSVKENSSELSQLLLFANQYLCDAHQTSPQKKASKSLPYPNTEKIYVSLVSSIGHITHLPTTSLEVAVNTIQFLMATLHQLYSQHLSRQLHPAVYSETVNAFLDAITDDRDERLTALLKSGKLTLQHVEALWDWMKIVSKKVDKRLEGGIEARERVDEVCWNVQRLMGYLGNFQKKMK